MKSIRFFSILSILLCIVLSVRAQVSGVVVDNTGEPLIGVNVMVKGTTIGTITDFDGNFAIDVAPPATIVVSYMGYDTKELEVVGSEPVNITLTESTELLEEVVVIGYGVQKKSDLTGSIAQVSDKDLQKQPSPSLGAALEGRAAGNCENGADA